eukprot:CAMPEP_0174373372 /NCGR_PEP_ID=MMETSP0811_2-20130205/106834_1 /TAXON_ID=73025 ORGANISM="Eutreptiella gymnastica-like, Strain CCMP1594" /NCGR_SAMPLE_ID=MMETSP0811_2 /ASSEMBLY_ACC=CAM_ASM_000667 /LENGTH=46 /DNA_ID= /DNA_START= /DNA_END= /DNA_ORIENTATION=
MSPGSCPTATNTTTTQQHRRATAPATSPMQVWVAMPQQLGRLAWPR